MPDEPTNFRKHAFIFAERRAIFEAYKETCIYCNNLVQWKDFEVDHIINESLARDPKKLQELVREYGLPSNFSVNSFENWACSHKACNRAKADTTYNKSRSIHYLMIAEKKAKEAERIWHSFEQINVNNKILNPIRTQIENGAITRQSIFDFANAVITTASKGLGDPTIITFEISLVAVVGKDPQGKPFHLPTTYDWMEELLEENIRLTIETPFRKVESERDGDTVSFRYAFWDLDTEKEDILIKVGYFVVSDQSIFAS